jgi:hypothetical protein
MVGLQSLSGQHTGRLASDGRGGIDHHHTIPYKPLDDRPEKRIVGTAKHQLIGSGLDQRLQVPA